MKTVNKMLFKAAITKADGIMYNVHDLLSGLDFNDPELFFRIYAIKKLVNDLKQDDRYTSKTKKIINNIDSLFNKLIRAYKNFEPHDDLDKGTVVGVFDNIRLVAKKNQKNQNK